MGLQMEPNFDLIQHKTHATRERMVDNEKTIKQSVPKSGNALDWTKILTRNNLESPGYRETVDQMKKEGRLKTKPKNTYNELSAKDRPVT